MKLSAVFTALFASAVAFSSAVNAADSGTISFNGLVTDQTCNVTNSANGDFTVTLPTVKASELNTNNTAGDSNFRIGVKDCSAAPNLVTNVRAQFKYNASNVDLTTGALLNQGGTATFVALQLFNPQDATIIKPGDAGAAASFTVAADGTGEMIYGVRYIKYRGVSTSGSVISRVAYQLSYN
ncbi:fimbrial protein [Serratia sp. S1B]|nr:fimbrial protein [Serratia sp. S1B]